MSNSLYKTKIYYCTNLFFNYIIYQLPEILKSLIQNVDKDIASAAVAAAIKAGANQSQAASAGLIGAIAAKATEEAEAAEAGAITLKEEIQALKMEKLEKRMDRLRDIEELMEVERVGLLMERRDLYFKRCRFWLGD